MVDNPARPTTVRQLLQEHNHVISFFFTFSFNCNIDFNIETNHNVFIPASP